MKKIIIIMGLILGFICLVGDIGKEPSIVTKYEITELENSFNNGDFVNIVEYYEMSDVTWKTKDYEYKFRLEITGRMKNAVKDSTFIFLSNIKDITFEQAWKASGFSSDINDYFKKEEVKFVGYK